jgi:hypothetical protein
MEGKHFSLLFEEADKLGVSPAVYTPKGGETSEEANQRVKEFFMVNSNSIYSIHVRFLSKYFPKFDILGTVHPC